MEKGCPQGSTSSPTIWNMLMDELLTTLRMHGVPHVAYADDLLLVINAESRADIEFGATAAMDHVCRWGRKAGVEVSSTKTEAMMLRSPLDANRPPIIRYGESRVAVVRAVKYLGVWVTPGVKFDRHIRETAEKLRGVIAPLRRVLRKDWGLKRKACTTWLNGLLLPITMYAAVVWYDSVDGARIERLQRDALYAIIRVCLCCLAISSLMRKQRAATLSKN